MEAGDGTVRARSHLSLSWNVERETQHGSHEEGSSKPCLVFTRESKDVRARRKLGYTATTGGGGGVLGLPKTVLSQTAHKWQEGNLRDCGKIRSDQTLHATPTLGMASLSFSKPSSESEQV